MEALSSYICLRDGSRVRGGNRRDVAFANEFLAALLNIPSPCILFICRESFSPEEGLYSPLIAPHIIYKQNQTMIKLHPRTDCSGLLELLLLPWCGLFGQHLLGKEIE